MTVEGHAKPLCSPQHHPPCTTPWQNRGGKYFKSWCLACFKQERSIVSFADWILLLFSTMLCWQHRFKRCLQNKYLKVICSVVWTLGNRSYVSTEGHFQDIMVLWIAIVTVLLGQEWDHEEHHAPLIIAINNLFMKPSANVLSREENDNWTFTDLIVILVLIKNLL